MSANPNPFTVAAGTMIDAARVGYGQDGEPLTLLYYDDTNGYSVVVSTVTGWALHTRRDEGPVLELVEGGKVTAALLEGTLVTTPNQQPVNAFAINRRVLKIADGANYKAPVSEPRIYLYPVFYTGEALDPSIDLNL